MRVVCIDGERQYWDIVQRDIGAVLEAAGHELHWYEQGFADPEAAIARAAGFDALLVVGDAGPVPAGLLRANPSIRLVSFIGTGAHRFVDLREAAETGAAVTNVPDFASDSVAEQAIGLMFAVARRTTEADRIVRSGGWSKNKGLKLAGRQLGVVGAGAIGSRVIARGLGLGMHPVYWSRTRSEARDQALGVPYLELPELFRTSSVVSLHLLHTAQTEGIIGAELLDLLPPDAIVINTARAEILDTAHLYRLLERGAIFGAGLDVYPTEPPDLSALPTDVPNLVLTPHIGFHTDEADVVFRVAGANIVAFAAGRPQNVLTPWKATA